MVQIKHYFIYYKIDSDNSQDVEEFFEYITQPPAINSFISSTMNGENFTANLPDGCLIAWFPKDVTLQEVHQYFQDAVSSLSVGFQDLVCVEMVHMNSLFLGRIAP